MSARLNETQARRSEIELMRGRVRRLTMDGTMSTQQRIGACLALAVLDERAQELLGRSESTDSVAEVGAKALAT